MWEIFGPFVRWPLYSPSRFFAVVAVVLVGVFVMGGVNDGNPSAAADVSASSAEEARPTASARAVAAPSVTIRPTAVATPASATDDLSEASGAADSAADAAAAFVAAWARPDRKPAAWAAHVRPLVTPELWSTGLSVTNPSSTPAVTVAGEPREVEVSKQKSVYDVPTSGAWIRVELVPHGDGWLVSMVEPTE